MQRRGFFNRLPEVDEKICARYNDARAKNQLLRYVADPDAELGVPRLAWSPLTDRIPLPR